MAEILEQRAGLYAHKPAIIFEGRSHIYEELNASVKEHACLLRQWGVKKGDRIAIQLPKGMEFIYLHLASLSLGAVTVPLNVAYGPEEVRYFLADSGSSLFFTDRAVFGRVKDALTGLENIRTVLIDSDGSYESLPYALGRTGSGFSPGYSTQSGDVAMICYTSGTTGKPKGAMITHMNLVSNTAALHEAWQWTDRDVLLHVLPLFHIHGLCVALHGGLYAASTIIMHKNFDPAACWQAMEKENCTIFMAVPTIYYRLMNEWASVRPDLTSMRVFISGSAPLREDLFHQFRNLTGFEILERYGMTEAQMIASNPLDPKRRVPGSVGYPLPGVGIRVVSPSGEDVAPGETGEVWVAGENVCKGYWQKPGETEKSFAGPWFRTGDLAYRDESDQGRLYLVGRAKELVISGGFNVYPKEVENVLNQHASVRESAVVGLEDEDLGEKVVAAVVLKKEGVAAGELISYCKKRLAGYKCPKDVFFVRELPRNAMGKVQKHVLVKMLSAEV